MYQTASGGGHLPPLCPCQPQREGSHPTEELQHWPSHKDWPPEGEEGGEEGRERREKEREGEGRERRGRGKGGRERGREMKGMEKRSGRRGRRM